MARQASIIAPADSVETEKFRTTPISASITQVKSLPKSAIIYQCAASQYWQFRVFMEGKQRKRTTEETDKDLALKKARLMFGRFYRSAGLSNASSHSGRRTFLTGLAHKGVNVRVLAALAGHKNISTTQRYIEVGEYQLRAAVEMV